MKVKYIDSEGWSAAMIYESTPAPAIPGDAVEAAKEAMCEVTPPPGVSKAAWLAEHGRFALIAGAIAAAAPHMLAEAWDQGYTTGNAHNGRRDANPYRPTP